MTDKLTDSEIVKALDICSKYTDVKACEKCPLKPNCDVNVLETLALDLINRLQAENKNLQERNVILMGLVDTQKAENERFGELKMILRTFWEVLLKIGMAKRKEKPTLEEFAEALQEIKADAKAEAYKECIEKVKEKSNKSEWVSSGVHLRTEYTIDENTLNNLLKEMGEDK